MAQKAEHKPRTATSSATAKAWAARREAELKTAATHDPATGGEVKIFNLMTDQHNLNHPYGSALADIKNVDRAIIDRGMVMNTAFNMKPAAPFKLKDAAASNSDLAEAVEKLNRGELSAEAPCDGAYSTWLAQDLRALESSLSKVFGF